MDKNKTYSITGIQFLRHKSCAVQALKISNHIMRLEFLRLHQTTKLIIQCIIHCIKFKVPFGDRRYRVFHCIKLKLRVFFGRGGGRGSTAYTVCNKGVVLYYNVPLHNDPPLTLDAAGFVAWSMFTKQFPVKHAYQSSVASNYA